MPYRASDHDPIIVGLRLNAGPTADANGPYTVGEGGSVSLSATGTDPNGDALTYDWDLDDNGSYETPGQTVTFSRRVDRRPDDAHRRRPRHRRDIVGDRHRAGDDHERRADRHLRRAGDGRRGLLVHARADEPGRPVARRHRSRLHVCVRLRLGLRRLQRRGDKELPDVQRRHALGRREDPRQGRRRDRVPRNRPGDRGRVEPLPALGGSFIERRASRTRCARSSADGAINAYINQVEAQAGKTLTHAQAELLIRLARKKERENTHEGIISVCVGCDGRLPPLRTAKRGD